MEINFNGIIEGNLPKQSEIKAIAIDEYCVVFLEGNIENIILRIAEQETYLLISLRSGIKYALNHEFSQKFISKFHPELFIEAEELYKFACESHPDGVPF